MEKPDLSDLAAPGTRIALRVTPRASANRITRDETGLRVYVTTAPEGGKATRAVQKLLAKAIGIAPSRLSLVSGATARDKVFEVG